MTWLLVKQTWNLLTIGYQNRTYLKRHKESMNTSKVKQEAGQIYIDYDVQDAHISPQVVGLPKSQSYTVYRNKIYNVSEFKKSHPGGSIIQLAIGRDSTELLECYHPEAAKVQEVLSKYYFKDVANPISYPDNSFFKTLKKNINAKLTELGYTRHSYQPLAIFEVVFTLFLYFLSTYMIAESDSKQIGFLFTILIGLISSRMGMLMHMGGHGSISSNMRINNIIERCLQLIGGSSIRWRFEHAFAHHIAPNQLGMDTDCTIGDPYMRLHPGIRWKWYHVYQAPMIVSAMSVGIIKWYFADFFAFAKTIRPKKTQTINPDAGEWVIFLIFKSLFIYLHIIWPAVKHGYSWAIFSTVLHLVITAHYLYQVFIVSHIQEGLVPNNNSHWAVKQIEGSADWGVGSHWANWVSAGLNHQVIHHLFPSMTHWVYPALAPVVEQTCKDFGIKYVTFSSFGSAWLNMYRYLDRLGNNKIKFQAKQD